MTFPHGDRNDASQVKHRERGDKSHALLSALPKYMILLLTWRMGSLSGAVIHLLLSYSRWNKMAYLDLGRRGAEPSVEAGWAGLQLGKPFHQEKKAAAIQDSTEPISAKSWDSWQWSCNGRARFISTKQHRFQCPSMALGSCCSSFY